MKSKTLRIAALSFGLMLFSASTLFAQSEGGDRGTKPLSIEELFKKMDKNEDGKLALKEIKGPLKDDFKKIDTNEDGFLSKEELKKAPKPNKQRPQGGRN